MSSIIQYSSDIVRTFRGAAHTILDHDLDALDMTKEQLKDVAVAFEKVAAMANANKRHFEAMSRSSFY
jgi:hypothetical protein